jgi:hypothetical protein
MEAPSAMAAACRQVHRPGQAVAGDPGDRRTGPLSELVAGQLARLVDNNAQQPLGVVDEIQTDLRCRRAGRRAAWDHGQGEHQPLFWADRVGERFVVAVVAPPGQTGGNERPSRRLGRTREPCACVAVTASGCSGWLVGAATRSG